MVVNVITTLPTLFSHFSSPYTRFCQFRWNILPPGSTVHLQRSRKNSNMVDEFQIGRCLALLFFYSFSWVNCSTFMYFYVGYRCQSTMVGGWSRAHFFRRTWLIIDLDDTIPWLFGSSFKVLRQLSRNPLTESFSTALKIMFNPYVWYLPVLFYNLLTINLLMPCLPNLINRWFYATNFFYQILYKIYTTVVENEKITRKNCHAI